jgi:UDP-N-acetylglucosamine 2-epimerase (non-hydrolysing)
MELSKTLQSLEQNRNKKVILLVFGTRPEIIKLFILYRILKNSEEFFPVLVNTCQQKISGDVLEHIGVEDDITIEQIPNRSTDLNQLNAHLMNKLTEKFNSPSALIARKDIAGIIVQGDTASAYSGAIWGFLNEIPVMHVEAGLRTFDHQNPFPEEFFRESIGRASSLNFCPTHISYDNLVREGISAKKNYIVGNTINDAIINLIKENKIKEPKYDEYLLSTLHRRENWDNVSKYASILNDVITDNIVDEDILHIIHPNPLVKDRFNSVFAGKYPSKLKIKEPIHDYFEMLGLVRKSNMILTDSGGLQEESLFFNIPCGVMRKVTERPEVLDKNARLLTFDNSNVNDFLRHADEYKSKNTSEFDYTYGDGTTSEQIYEVLKSFYKL